MQVELLLPSYQLETVWPSPPDLWHQQGISTHKTTETHNPTDCSAEKSQQIRNISEKLRINHHVTFKVS